MVDRYRYHVLTYDNDENLERGLNTSSWVPVLISQVFVPSDGLRESLGGTKDHVETTIVYRITAERRRQCDELEVADGT